MFYWRNPILVADLFELFADYLNGFSVSSYDLRNAHMNAIHFEGKDLFAIQHNPPVMSSHLDTDFSPARMKHLRYDWATRHRPVNWNHPWWNGRSMKITGIRHILKPSWALEGRQNPNLCVSKSLSSRLWGSDQLDHFRQGGKVHDLWKAKVLCQL